MNDNKFAAFLAAIKGMTEDDLRDAIAACSIGVRASLADGPLRRRWSCGVCEAFGFDFYKGLPNAGSPIWRAWGYHEVPKLHAQRVGDSHYGPLANEIYHRTIATYRAAGWVGEVEAANA